MNPPGERINVRGLFIPASARSFETGLELKWISYSTTDGFDEQLSEDGDYVIEYNPDVPVDGVQMLTHSNPNEGVPTNRLASNLCGWEVIGAAAFVGLVPSNHERHDWCHPLDLPAEFLQMVFRVWAETS